MTPQKVFPKYQLDAETWAGCLQTALTTLFIFCLPLLFYIRNAEYNATKWAFAFVFLSALFALWSARALWKGAGKVRLPTLLWPLSALLAAGALSLLNATSLGAGLQQWAGLLYLALFYAYIANTVKDQRAFHLYLGAGLLAAALSGGYGLIQYAGILPGDPDWPEGGTPAMISSLGNKNFLAEFLSLWLIHSLLLLLRLKSAGGKVFALALAGACAAAFVAADSQGALLGFIGGCLALVGCAALLARAALQVLLKQKGWVAAWALLVGAAFFYFNGFSFTSPSQNADVGETPLQTVGLQGPWEALQEMISRYWEAESGRVRAWDWWIAYEMFKSQPWFGVGFGHYGVRFLEYKEQFAHTPQGQAFQFYIRRSDHAHNDYVQTAAETGVVGLAAVAFLLVVVMRKGIRSLQGQGNGQRQWAVLALYASAVAFGIDALVNFPSHLPASSFSLMLLLGLAHSPYLGAQAKEVVLGRRGGRALLGVLLVGSIGVTVLALRDWQADVHLASGHWLLNKGAYALAGEEYQRSLQLAFHPTEVLFRLGAVQYQLGDFQGAEAYFERSLRPFLVEDTYWNLAVVKYQLGKRQESLAYAKRLLTILPRQELVEQAKRLIEKLSEAP